MEKERFEKAIEINNKIELLRLHKESLLNSQINYGGSLIFHYNGTYKDGYLMDVLYGGKDFFKKYMDSLNNRIEELEDEFLKL